MNKKLILVALLIGSGMALLTNNEMYSHGKCHRGFYAKFHCRARKGPQAPKPTAAKPVVWRHGKDKARTIVCHRHVVRHCHRAPRVVVHRCRRPVVVKRIGFHGPRFGIGFGCGGMRVGFGFGVGSHCHLRHR